jgi:hypothetical protein
MILIDLQCVYNNWHENCPIKTETVKPPVSPLIMDFAFAPHWIYITFTKLSHKWTNFFSTALYYCHKVSWKLAKSLRCEHATYELYYEKVASFGGFPPDPTRGFAPEPRLGWRFRACHRRQDSGSFSFLFKTRFNWSLLFPSVVNLFGADVEFYLIN